MQIAVGAMMHETNTLTAGRTVLREFAPLQGAAVFEDHRWMNASSAGGIIQTLQEAGAGIVPSYFARALPSGLVTRETYDTIKSNLLGGILSAESLDGICLALHGSMFVEGLDDPEGDLLSSLRAQVGGDTPIVCALDMHATITPAMVSAANALTGYRTAPHTDAFDTGARAAKLLLYSVEHQDPLSLVYQRLPMLLSGEQSETAAQPMAGLMEQLESVDHELGILCTSYFLGFPWADSPHSGVSAVVTATEQASSAAADIAKHLAAAFWEKRREFDFTTEAYPLPEALDRALEDPGQPVVIADSGDNPTAGASQDLTLSLAAVCQRGLGSVLSAVVADPRAEEQCRQAGEGGVVHIQLGRVRPEEGAPPLQLQVQVKSLAAVDGVRAAAVTANGVDVVITDRRMAVTDPGFLHALGIDPKQYKIVIVKSGYLSPEYQQLAARKMLALTPGDTNVLLDQIPYRRVPRPIYPLDAI